MAAQEVRMAAAVAAVELLQMAEVTTPVPVVLVQMVV
jgi:hypothetical protein